MRISILILLLFPAFVMGQPEEKAAAWNLRSGSDLCLYDSLPFSLGLVEESLLNNSAVVFSPAGMERISENDVRKRHRYAWTSEYNSIYIRNSQGLVLEGMNERGFSASLMFLENCQLPEKEKELIPIGASLAVNFFLDHFKCVDTAILAVWDIRIFNDLEEGQDWPFRIVLHDTTGASAYIEYIDGQRQLYTPDHPAFVVGGPDYSRLIALEHIPDSLPADRAEKLYLDIVYSGYPPNIGLMLLQYYMQNFRQEYYYALFRYHRDRELFILTPDGDEAVFNFREIEFIPGKEVSTSFF